MARGVLKVMKTRGNLEVDMAKGILEKGMVELILERRMAKVMLAAKVILGAKGILEEEVARRMLKVRWPPGRDDLGVARSGWGGGR